MMTASSIAEINLPLLLIGVSGLILISILLILFLTNRNRHKKLFTKNQILESEITSLQTELNKKNDSLEDKIAFKTKELLSEIENRKAVEVERKIALKKAEEANFLKNAFLANMSHEIRTPLNGISGFSHLLLGEVEGQEKPELVDFAKGIVESSDRLLNLMGHIMDLSRIDANDYKIQIKNFEVNTVINDCIERVKNSVYKKGLIIEYKESETFLVVGDKAAFEKSIDLILDNSIKYTLNGKITISQQIDFNKNNLRIIIRDTGIGIDKNFLPSIFEAFRQESTGYSRLHQGAGLGLPLAQKLMLLMDGDIKLHSEKGKGTQVSLLLNLGETSIAEQDILRDKDQGATADSAEEKPKIFIVEDDKMNRLVFEKMLSNFAKFQIAVDGDDAFKQLGEALEANIAFDVILLDINLPAPWDGMMLLEEFKKKWPQLNQVPFIAQTAYAMTGDKEKFLAVGFDDYISKPINKKELFTIIENNIRKFSTLKY